MAPKEAVRAFFKSSTPGVHPSPVRRIPLGVVEPSPKPTSAAKSTSLFERFRQAAHAAHEVWSVLRLETWVIRGVDRSTGSPLCFSFSGSAPLKEYQANIALAPGYEEHSLGRPFVFLIAALARRRFPDCALSIVEVDDRHRRIARFLKTGLKNPVWMPLHLDIRTSLASSLKKRWFRDVFKSASENRLSFDVKRDDASFDDFYHNMYVPFVQERHGKTAVVSDYAGLKDGFRRGELVMIRRDGAYVAGAVVNFGHRQPRMMEMGIRGDSAGPLKEGIAEAVYLMTFARALERGGCNLMIGTSRGFLKDGPLNHKFHMGAVFGDRHYQKGGFLHFRVNELTAGVKSFFLHNPLIMAGPGGSYHAAFFADSPDAVTLDMKRLLERCAEKKMTPRLYLFAPPAAVAEALPRLHDLLGSVDIQSAETLLR